MDSKKKQLFIALGIGVIALFANHFYIQSELESMQPKKPVSVAVAAQAIQAGTPLAKKMVKFVRVPKDLAPKVSIPESDLEANLGNELAVPVQAGEYILDTYFRVKRAAGNRLSDQVAGEKFRAITIPVDQIDSFAGSVASGDKIDLLFTFGVPGTGQQMSVLLLQGVPVISTGSYSVTEQELGERGGRTKRFSSVTLLLNVFDAQRLNYARQVGKIDVVLRNSTDQANVDLKPIGGIQDILSGPEKEMFERARAVVGNPHFTGGNTAAGGGDQDRLKAQLQDFFQQNRKTAAQMPAPGPKQGEGN